MVRAHTWWILLLAGLFIACQKELRLDMPAQKDQFNLNIRFNPTVDGNPLVFNNTYINYFSEPYTIKTFKFYVSQIDLVGTDGSIHKVDRNSYYLINEADSSTATISIEPPARAYKELAFVIGVDSVRNVSGAQTGALDPANGMFWTWNSGYIMAKLEGSSPLSPAPDNRIEYHIGGFKEPYNVARRIVLPLPATPAFSAGSTNTVAISANVNLWFHVQFELHIAKTPVWMTPGDTAAKIADNYAYMFGVTSVTRNP